MAYLNKFKDNSSYFLRIIPDKKGLWYVVIGIWPEMMMNTERSPKELVKLNDDEILNLIYETKPEYCQVVNYKRSDMSEEDLNKHEENMKVKFKKNEFSEILSIRPIMLIIMDKVGISQLISEIKKVINIKEDAILNLTFVENKPKFNIKIKYKKNSLSESGGVFEVTVGFNINFSSIKDERHDVQYLYQDGGADVAYTYDYLEDELNKFVNDLSEEI